MLSPAHHWAGACMGGEMVPMLKESLVSVFLSTGNLTYALLHTYALNLFSLCAI